MRILYSLTSIGIIILHILLYKKEEKQNILKWIVIDFVLYVTYLICICVIMSLIKIPITLETLSIVNSLISVIFIIKIIQHKKIQKYYICKFDVLAISIISVVTFLLVFKFYGIPFDLKNSITDGAVHYYAAEEFYKTNQLLQDDIEPLNLWSLSTFMPGAYINTGIVFKVLDGLIEEIYFCDIYIIVNIFMWLLSGILMFFLLKDDKKDEKNQILPLLFSIIYMLAYPLDSLISGFSYLSLALDIIIAILMVMKLEIDSYQKAIYLFFLNFGLYFSYYYFMPVVYLAVFLEIIIVAKQKKHKLLSKDCIIPALYSVFLPGFFGLLYFQMIPFITMHKEVISTTGKVMGLEGTIYQNFIGNIVLFLVLAIWNFINKVKQKNTTVIEYGTILSILFLSVMLIGMLCNVVSSYYYFKIYYLLWIFVVSGAYSGLKIILQKGKTLKRIGYSCIGLYCLGMCIAILINKNLIFFDIFQQNAQYIQNAKALLYHEELEIIAYYNQHINMDPRVDNKTYYFLSPSGRGRTTWIYVLTKNPYVFINTTYGEYTFDLKDFINSDNQYAVIFKEDYLGNFEEMDKEIEKFDLNILFRNEWGIILEKN